MKQSFNDILEESKIEFLEKIDKKFDELYKSLESMNGKMRSEVKTDDLSALTRELHNIRSVAGSYEIDFLVSAVRNITDHISHIYELNANEVIDGSLAKEIFDLTHVFLKDIKTNDSGVLDSKLESIIKKNTEIKRVLLVEKDDGLVSHFKKLFKKYKISYSIVTSGKDAFNRLLDEQFDLLITDLHIGKLDGPSLIAANRVSGAFNKDIQTVMLSVSYFDLLPSISVPDLFLSKNESLLEELDHFLERFSKGEFEAKLEDPLNILCLDDDQNIHDLLNISFRNHNINYRSSFDIKSFTKEYLKEKPDLVILDLVLEDESGIDAINHLKESGELLSIPVIILSSLEGGLKNELVKDVPFIIATLSKPFTPKSMGKEVISLYQQSKKSLRL